MTPGWIKLHRCIEDSLFFGDAELLRLWLYLYLHASHTERDVMIGGGVVHLFQGQLVTGRHKIACALDLDESRVRRMLKKLERIREVTIKTTNKFSLITLEKWSVFQLDEQNAASKKAGNRTADDQVATTYKNEENVKNGEETIFPPTVEAISAYCSERGNSIDPQCFFDYYEANGWVQGRGKPIKNWRAAVRTWENRSGKERAQDEFTDVI